MRRPSWRIPMSCMTKAAFLVIIAGGPALVPSPWVTKDSSAAESKEKKSDADLLQGTWVRVSTEAGGQEQRVEPGMAPDLGIKNDLLAFGGVNDNAELQAPEGFK